MRHGRWTRVSQVGVLSLTLLSAASQAGSTAAAQSEPVVVESFAQLRDAVEGGATQIDVTQSLMFTSTIVLAQGAAVTISSSVSATLSGGGSVRLFHVRGGSRLVLDSLTLQNGSAPTQPSVCSDYASCAGGAIFVDGVKSALELRSSLVRSNLASLGGAIAVCDGGRIYSTACRFEDNTATDAGGAWHLQNSDANYVHSVEFWDNHAFQGGAVNAVDSASIVAANCSWARNSAWESAGAIRLKNNVSLVVSDSTFETNTAHHNAGALFVRYSSLATTRCVFTANRADESAGAMFVWTDSEADVTDCSFWDNSAQYAGALRVDSVARLTGSVFSANSASSAGAIGVNKDGLLTTYATRFEGNRASDKAGAIYIYKGSLHVHLGIFTANTATQSSHILNDRGSVHCDRACPANAPSDAAGCTSVGCHECQCWSCDCGHRPTTSPTITSTPTDHIGPAATDHIGPAATPARNWHNNVPTYEPIAFSASGGMTPTPVLVVAAVVAAGGTIVFVVAPIVRCFLKVTSRIPVTGLRRPSCQTSARLKKYGGRFVVLALALGSLVVVVALVRTRQVAYAIAPRIVYGSPEFLGRMATSTTMAEETKPWWWDILVFNITRVGVLHGLTSDLLPADVKTYHCDDTTMQLLGVIKGMDPNIMGHRIDITSLSDPVYCAANPFVLPGCNGGFYGTDSAAKPCPEGFFCPEGAVCYIACPPGTWCGKLVLNEDEDECLGNDATGGQLPTGFQTRSEKNPYIAAIQRAIFDSFDKSVDVTFDRNIPRAIASMLVDKVIEQDGSVTVNVEYVNGTKVCPGRDNLILCPEGSYCESTTRLSVCPAGHRCSAGSILPVPCEFPELCRGSGNGTPDRTLLGLFAALTTLGVAWLFRRIWDIKQTSAVMTRTSRMEVMKGRGRSARRQLEFTISMRFSSLSLTVSSASKGRLRVVDGLSGALEPGRITAILGPSGAGKTSVLDTLAGRVSNGTVTGALYINGQLDTVHSYSSWVGMVPQDDIMFRELTVVETLVLYASLRLPPEMETEMDDVIADVIDILGLWNVVHSVIGDETARGISGGERKRVNIGIELVSRPALLFCDEPTSGLDSTKCIELLDGLRGFADLKCNIVVALHQPSHRLFQMFDDLLLLGRGGQTIYLGDGSGALAHFESMGFVLPAYNNPADFFLDIVGGKTGDAQTGQLAEIWRKQYQDGAATRIQTAVRESYLLRGNLGVPSPTRGSGSRRHATRSAQRTAAGGYRGGRIMQPFARATLDFTRRALIQLLRNRTALVFDVAAMSTMGTIIGRTWAGSGAFFADLLKMVPATAMISFGLGVTISLGSLHVFGAERVVFWREAAPGSGMSLPRLPYFLAKNVVDWVRITVLTIIFIVPIHSFVLPLFTLPTFLMLCLPASFAMSGYSYLLSTLVDPKTSQLMTLCWCLTANLYSGTNPTLPTIDRRGGSWLNSFMIWSSPFRWLNEDIIVASTLLLGDAWKMPPGWYHQPLHENALLVLLSMGYSERFALSSGSSDPTDPVAPVTFEIHVLNLPMNILIGVVTRLLAFAALCLCNREKMGLAPFSKHALASLARLWAGRVGGELPPSGARTRTATDDFPDDTVELLQRDRQGEQR